MKPLLSLYFFGQDLKKFGDTDYAAALENFNNQSQLGSPTALNNDFFGSLALASSGLSANDQTVIDSKNFIPAHQNLEAAKASLF